MKRIGEGKSRDRVEKIRATEDHKARNTLKADLPSYCFSGEFRERSIAGLEKHSGLVCLDFDHLGERLAGFKERVTRDEYIHAAFVSPSGDGLKVLVKIPPSEITHAQSCKALADYFHEETLDNFEDVSRVCFESYDPDLFYNPRSKVFTTLKKNGHVNNSAPPASSISNPEDIIDRLVKWLESKGEHYVDGNKHVYLVKLAGACNRFGVGEFDVSSSLARRYQRQDAPAKDIEKIVRDCYRNYSHQNGQASFEESGAPVYRSTREKAGEEVFDMSLPLKDVIYLDSVRDSMLHDFHNGRGRGETTHFQAIDEAFRWKRGELTIVSGIMNHGKSALLMQLCLVKSVIDGYKWAVFSPEQHPAGDWYDDLIHAYVGKNTQPYYGDQMSEQEYKMGLDFVKDHFYYIFPEMESPTPEYINRNFKALVDKHGIDGCVIDPFNQLDADYARTGGREDIYISRFLTKQKRFAQLNDVFMVVVTHPRNALERGKNGNYDPPDVFQLSGGMMWGNKSDNILCVHRPYWSTDRKNSLVLFQSQKIKKQSRNGIPGDVYLNFDPRTFRYREVDKDFVHPLDRKQRDLPLEYEEIGEAPF